MLKKALVTIVYLVISYWAYATSLKDSVELAKTAVWIAVAGFVLMVIPYLLQKGDTMEQQVDVNSDEYKRLGVGDFVTHAKRDTDNVRDFSYCYRILHKNVISCVDETPMVVYQALYGEMKVFCRPMAEFFAEVDKERFPTTSQNFTYEKIPHGALLSEIQSTILA